MVFRDICPLKIESKPVALRHNGLLKSMRYGAAQLVRQGPN